MICPVDRNTHWEKGRGERGRPSAKPFDGVYVATGGTSAERKGGGEGGKSSLPAAAAVLRPLTPIPSRRTQEEGERGGKERRIV